MRHQSLTCSLILVTLALLLGVGVPAASARNKQRTLPLTAERGEIFDATPMSRREWSKTIRNDPAVPRTIDQLEALAVELFQTPGQAANDSDEPLCGTIDLARFERGLRNPALNEEELRRIDQMIAKDQPPISDNYDNKYFHIRYTEGSGSGQITDATAEKIAKSLESTRLFYVGLFGKSPNTPINVIVHKARAGHGGSYVGGTIYLDSADMKKGDSWIGNISAHELFHALQSAFSAKKGVADWFIEGSAVWAASYRTDGWAQYKDFADFDDYGETSIFKESYNAMPFITYIQGFKMDGAAKTWSVKFLLENLQRQKAPNARKVLEELLKKVLSPGHRGIPELTCRYALAKVTGEWRRQGTGYNRTEDISYLTPLRALKGGKPFIPRVKKFTRTGSLDSTNPVEFPDLTLNAGTTNLFEVALTAGQYVDRQVKATLTSSSNFAMAAATISATKISPTDIQQDASSAMAFLRPKVTSTTWTVAIPKSTTDSVYVAIVDGRVKNIVGKIVYSLKLELQSSKSSEPAMSKDASIVTNTGKKASVALVLDNSSSMSAAVSGSDDTQIDLLETDADTFITVMQNAGKADKKLGKIGLVNFNYYAHTLADLKSLDAAGTVAQATRTAVNSLTADGRTNVKGGITSGHSMLKGDVGSATYQPAMILFSDGMWNDGGDPTSNLSTDIPIYTIGYNSAESSIDYLKTIATNTSGKYYHTGDPTILSSIYFDIVNDTDIGDSVTNVTHQLKAYTPQAVKSQISEGTEAAIFATAWIDHAVTYTGRTPAKGEISLVLHDPSGKKVTPTVVDAPPGKGHAVLTVSKPDPGEWTLYGWFGSDPKLTDVGTAFGTFVPPDSISQSLEALGSAGDRGGLTVRTRVTDGGEPVQLSRVQAHLVRPLHSREALLSRFEDRIQQLKAQFPDDGETDPTEAALRAIRQERLPDEDIFAHEKRIGDLVSALDDDWQHVSFEEVRAGVPHHVFVVVSGYSPRTRKHFTRTKMMTVVP